MNDATSLICCLTTIEQKYKENVVIVPGGGIFSDLVRASQQQWKFNDGTAHQMAVLAMKQMALLFQSIKPAFLLAESVQSIQKIILNQRVVIWSPDIQELDAFSIKASWGVTSDSLAAWLACQLNAVELILVKSAKIPSHLNLQQMQKNGLVDEEFYNFTENSLYKITLINKHQFNEPNSI